MTEFSAPLRLRMDEGALLSNWRWLKRQGGDAACGAAIKADGYGLGAVEVMRRLLDAGCRDFFVSNWAEAAVLEPLVTEGVSLSVLHGVREEDLAVALASRARPVLCTEWQIARWRHAGGGPCDVMVDTGMNRLGLDWRGDIPARLAGLEIATLMSHLACADEDGPLSPAQLERFSALRGQVKAARYSLANSAGICMGADYAFDMTRPGIALYGGVPRREAAGHIRQVVVPEAQVLQRRRVRAGDTIGYNATYRAPKDMQIAVLNLGYADGYLRCFSGRGSMSAGGRHLPVVGRISMDLTAVDVSGLPDISEEDWLEVDYKLVDAAAASGLSQYELLTGLGARFDRVWR
ncbi:alanine racemase [Sphingobium indicum]|uniref:alanine racemase n=2 Tax=Sphingobium indicum TaxID=332055 RepID=A0A1L5BMK2_SPHIB|nr:alanine racemase [Sphingobium indicum]APL94068.1 alanine racemase [Sphingobium indicum B90A]KEY98954.1 alanine racemase [Sphingomonas sp. BHC-A]NYI21348.1 alanine racemase [Sphingobium indicum]RYM03855.1 alanine racemase [Sphingobium indicum]